MCGECCYGEGGININEEEIERISCFLGLTGKVLLEEYCYNRNDKVSIKSGPDGFCIFFDKKTSCRIHPVKPAICTQWPFFQALIKYRSAWKLAQEACPGINPESSHEEFVEQANNS